MSAGKLIVIVDDEPAIRRVLEIKLTLAGYTVACAEDGESGLALILDRRPDAAIVDLGLPRMDGRTLCQRVEAAKRERPFLTIVSTGSADRDDTQEWVCRLTDTVIIPKPFSPAAILTCIDKYVRKGT